MTSPTKISALDFHNKLIEEKGIEDATGFSAASRIARFKAIRHCLKRFRKTADLRILDYGCADGNLLDYLPNSEEISYLGIDINPAFIKQARRNWKSAAKFSVGDLCQSATLKQIAKFKPTVTVASGVLCLSAEANNFRYLIEKLYTLSEEGFICNMLTADTDRQVPGIVRWTYQDVLSIVDYCGCDSWEIIRSYLHNDMTLVMCKNWIAF